MNLSFFLVHIQQEGDMQICLYKNIRYHKARRQTEIRLFEKKYATELSTSLVSW